VGGIEHLGADAVVRLVLETLNRGPSRPTRTLGPALSRFGKRGARSRSASGSRVSKRSGGSVHVRVGRNPLLAIYGDECLRRNGDITESWERHGVLQLPARDYLSCGMTRSLINFRFSSCSA